MYQGNTNWITIIFHAQERPAQKQRILHKVQGNQNPPQTLSSHTEPLTSLQLCKTPQRDANSIGKITTWSKNLMLIFLIQNKFVKNPLMDYFNSIYSNTL